MASASVLQKLTQRAREAEEMIGQLKQQIELVKQTAGKLVWPRGYKTFFMLNSAEHEIFSAHKY